MESTFNPLEKIFGLLDKKIEADAVASARKTFDARGELYGVDESGRIYHRGAPTGYGIAGVPPIALIGVGILAIVLLVRAAKS